MAVDTLEKHNCHLWIDLSAFPGAGEDYGASKFLGDLGFIPSTISLLCSCPDFVHEHDGVIDDTPLRWEYSSLNGWKRDVRWTRKMLKRLVQKLHQHRIKVLLSCMANAYHPEFERMSDWAGQHKELFLVHDTGAYSFIPDGRFAGLCFYNIAARFKDGSYYEDLFASQVRKTVVDYSFDGFHAADGYKSFILGIMAAGFSPDMLAQFEAATGITLPDYGKRPLVKTIPPVAKWIWKNRREEWIDFWRRRLAWSWQKVAAELASCTKEFAINSCWCTDPLESVTRYGMDTTELQKAPTKTVYFETMEIYTEMGPVSGPKSLRREGYILESHEFYPASLTAALLRATHTPKIKMYAMIHVHDQFERFEFLKSGRSHLEKSIVGFQQLYRVQNGKPEPAVEGIFPTLATGVCAEDWKFLKESDDLARSIRPAEIPGAVALWSESTIDNEIGTSNRQWSVHRTIYEIAGAGCPIITASHVRELAGIKNQVLFWANPASFTKQEQAAIWKAARRNRLIAFDSKGAFAIPSAANVLSVLDAHSGARLSVTGTKRQLKLAENWLMREALRFKSKALIADVEQKGGVITITPARKARPFEYRADMESHFMTRVPPTRLAMPYLELVAGIARKVGWPLISEVRVNEGPCVGELAGHENNLFYIRSKNGKLYLFANNLHRYASYLSVQWAQPVLQSRQLNSVMFQPKPDGKRIELMIPPGGVVIYEVKLKSSS